MTRTSSHAHHGEILEELATDRTSASDEQMIIGNLLLESLAEDGVLSIVAAVDSVVLASRDHRLVSLSVSHVGRSEPGHALQGVKVQPLLDGHELSGAGLHHFLGDDAAEDGAHGGYVASADLGKRAEQLLVEVLLANDAVARAAGLRVQLLGDLDEGLGVALQKRIQNQ